MNSSESLNCFKAYDIRGKLGDELNEDIAYRIGFGVVKSLNAKTVVLGFDARKTSLNLGKAVGNGICDAGADVIEIGLAGTEEMYAAVSEFTADAGIEITASHNPIEYNGMKIVKDGSQPLSGQEFKNIKLLAEANDFILSSNRGLKTDKRMEARDAYIAKILNFIDLESLKPLKIVINSGNGAAGPTIDILGKKLINKGVKTNLVYLHHDPDPSFPNGIPNPMIEENRLATSNLVVEAGADFGVAFDGDFDRCFIFDHLGSFIPGEYVVGLLAEVFLKKEQSATIVHDPRIIWSTQDIIRRYNGHAVKSKTGHAFMKATMRHEGAIYGGEMSAHHYFRDFAYCDSGMIPWLLIWQLLSQKNLSLAELIRHQIDQFPSSGEKNFIVASSEKCLEKIKEYYFRDAIAFDEIDGLTMSFECWRFNLRQSNTEPLVRLNIETKANKSLLQEKTLELVNLISNG